MSAIPPFNEDEIISRIPIYMGQLGQDDTSGQSEDIITSTAPATTGAKRPKNTKHRTDRLVLMQFPTYPRQQSLSHSNKLRKCQAQYKKASELYQIALPLDTRSITYAYERGLEYGVGSRNVEQQSKQTWQQSSVKKDIGRTNDDYYKPSVQNSGGDRPLEHLIFEGRRLPLVMSSAQYMVGRFRGTGDKRELHLTPLHSIVQFRPTNNHLDGLDRHEKQSKHSSSSNGNESMSTDESSSEQEEYQQIKKEKEKTPAAQKKVAMQKKNEIVDATTAAHKRTIVKRLTEQEQWSHLQVIDDMSQFGFIKDKLIHNNHTERKADVVELECETVSR